VLLYVILGSPSQNEDTKKNFLKKYGGGMTFIMVVTIITKKFLYNPAKVIGVHEFIHDHDKRRSEKALQILAQITGACLHSRL